MPRVVVRKSYRCQPGRRRDVLAALQRIDAAAAEAGYPRGRYLFVETRAAGEPDLEVEFAFESYAEMEQLERRMREHVARFLRDGGATGQEFLLEPSGTKYLLLVEETRGAASPSAAQAPAAAASAGPGTSAPAGPQGARSSGTGAGAPSVPSSRSAAPAAPAGRSARAPEPEPAFDQDEDEFEGLTEEDLPEPDVPPPPDVPRGMTPAQFQQSQLARARAALTGAEKAVNLNPRPGGTAGQRRPPRADS